MQRGIIGSVLFHAMVAAVSFFGLPYLSATPALTETPIIVEIVNVDDFTNPPPLEPEIKPEPEAKEEPPPPPPEPPKADPIPEPVAEPVPEPEPELEPEVVALPPEPKPKPKAKPKPEKEPEAKKPTPNLVKAKLRKKPKAPKPPDAFASVLKTIADLKKSTPKPEPEPKKEEKKPESDKPSFAETMAKALATPSRKHNPSQNVSISEIEVVRRQFIPCWNLSAGARGAENLAIEIAMVMSPDGRVRQARIVDEARMKSDPFFRSAAESALRAVLNPRCNPLRLPPEKYEQWQTMTLNFDPREMF